MKANEYKLIELIIREVGGNIIQIADGDTNRFFMGVLQTPTKEDNYLLIDGYDITNLMDVLLKKDAKDAKIEIIKHCADVNSIKIKCNNTVQWYCYTA